MFKDLLQSIKKIMAERRERAESRRLQKEKMKRWVKYFRASENVR